jgi:hypothetical protein
MLNPLHIISYVFLEGEKILHRVESRSTKQPQGCHYRHHHTDYISHIGLPIVDMARIWTALPYLAKGTLTLTTHTLPIQVSHQ